MRPRLIYTLLIAVLILLPGCREKCEQGDNCTLKPQAGPCYAYIPRYYFDQEEEVCKEFTWGGCEGVVPYETLEACQADCECKD